MHSNKYEARGGNARLTARISVEDEVHNEMMKTCINELKKLGFTNLRATFENMTRPEQISGYVPDFTFNKNNKQGISVIFEVETCSTIMHEHIEKKWKTFYQQAKATGGEFHLAVPKFCNGDSGRTLADQKLGELNIKADVIWAVNGTLRHRTTRTPTHNESP